METLLTPNTVLQHRYRIVGLVARGGMGAIYEATDENLGIRVALKQRLLASTLLQHAFRQEARLLARLNHPALARVTDYFTTDDQEFLVMEFIPGPDLAQELAARGAPFALGDVLSWTNQLLDALDYLHTQTPAPIFHRDIKPQNLKRRQQGSIALLDFGIAKGSLADMTQVSHAPSVMAYTRGFAPLEQIDGLGTDARTDLYGLAATMYMLLTNIGPSDATTRDRAEARSLPDPLRPLHEVNDTVPQAVSAVFMRALALHPDDRPPSAAAMRAALHDAINAPAARPVPVITAPTAQESRTEIDTGSSESVRAKPSTTGTQRRNHARTDAQALRQPAQVRRSPWLWLAGLVAIAVVLGASFLAAQGQFASSPPPTPTTGDNTVVRGLEPTALVQPNTTTVAPIEVTEIAPTARPLPTVAVLPSPTIAEATPTTQPTQTVAVPTVVPVPPGRIAFYSQRDGLAEIYVMNADGSAQVRLTINDAVDWDPSWSPDGQQIAFISNRDGSGDIYRMNADGSEQTRLTTSDADDFAPAWSPDGQRIAFMAFRDGNPEIYAMNADGSNQTRLTFDNAVEGFPSWSPDSQQIAFMSERDGNREIYVMNADGSNPVRLTTNDAIDDNPAWSPDGQHIAFKSERDGSRDVYMMNADGTQQVRLTFPGGDGFAPAWSPDGTQIVFQTSRDNGSEEIYRMNADGTNPLRLTDNATNISDGEPSWSR